MTIRFLTYEITDDRTKKLATVDNFNYGKLSFVYTIFGESGTFQGPWHWMNHPRGVLFADSPDADDYLPQLKIGYTATIKRFSPPLQLLQDLQAGIYTGNFLKASLPLQQAIAKGLPLIAP